MQIDSPVFIFFRDFFYSIAFFSAKVFWIIQHVMEFFLHLFFCFKDALHIFIQESLRRFFIQVLDCVCLVFIAICDKI